MQRLKYSVQSYICIHRGPGDEKRDPKVIYNINRQ